VFPFDKYDRYTDAQRTAAEDMFHLSEDMRPMLWYLARFCRSEIAISGNGTVRATQDGHGFDWPKDDDIDDDEHQRILRFFGSASYAEEWIDDKLEVLKSGEHLLVLEEGTSSQICRFRIGDFNATTTTCVQSAVTVLFESSRRGFSRVTLSDIDGIIELSWQLKRACILLDGFLEQTGDMGHRRRDPFDEIAGMLIDIENNLAPGFAPTRKDADHAADEEPRTTFSDILQDGELRRLSRPGCTVPVVLTDSQWQIWKKLYEHGGAGVLRDVWKKIGYEKSGALRQAISVLRPTLAVLELDIKSSPYRLIDLRKLADAG